MLLTSAQVSLAISSVIVFIFTTALFLCGYVVQQKTMNDIREAIKPQPRPIHTNLYVPPKPEAAPGPIVSGEDGAQVVEIVTEEQGVSEQETKSTEEKIGKQMPDETETDSGDGLVQGSDGGFLRISRQRQRKQKSILEDIVAKLRLEEYEDWDEDDGISNPRKSAGAFRGSTPDSRERLSRAARRKLLKEDLKNLAGEEKLANPNIYKRRRLY